MLKEKEKILIADNDINILASVFGDTDRYSVIRATSAKDAIDKAYAEIPDLIVGDLDLPKMSRLDFCEALRRNVLLKNTPIVVVPKNGEKLDGSIFGEIDDCIDNPLNLEELAYRINRILIRTESALNANPLTKLPGNILIKNEMNIRIKAKQKFATCFLDLDNFKAFNDRYGFDRGDEALKLTGKLVLNAVTATGIMENDFVGHIGGDDFVVITPVDKFKNICSKIVREFDQKIIELYDEKDLEKGSIISEDRKGRIRNFPIMTVSIAVVNYTSEERIHHAEICERGTELKKFVKSFSGSNYVEDRRKL